MKEYTDFVIENKSDENETITSFLRSHFVSDRYMTKLRKKFGYIKKNNEKCNASSRVKLGDKIEIYNNPDEKSSITPCIAPLDVVFEDDYLLIINKPSGLPTMPTKSHYDLNLAGAIMAYMLPKQPNFVCRILNRLDKDVCGLVVVAKNSFSASFFDLQKDSIQKIYHAIVHGEIKSRIVIKKKIKTETNDQGIQQMKRVVSTDGLDATTFVSPIKALDDKTLIAVKILNGRTHQIRLHTSSENHPILGDKLYGNENDEFDGIALICKKITVVHPVSFEQLTFEINYPNSFRKVLIGHKV